jgi:hypothetical protein
MLRTFLILVFSISVSFSAFADDVLDVVSFFHDPQDPIRVGIEIEFTGISIDEAMVVIQRVLGGKLDYSDIPWEMKITEADGTIKDVQLVYHRGRLKKSSVGGRLVIKPEYNDTSGITSLENMNKKVIIELLTDPGPIQFPGVVELQKALDALKAEGAIGTRNDVAVSLQVNVEIGEGKRENFKARHIVNLLRNYMREEHRSQIMERFNVPDIRLPFIQPLSPGFMDRLLDPNYDPTLEELKDDAIYRQLKELLGERKRAWSAPIEEIRQEVLKYIIDTDAFSSKDSPLFRVIKFSPIKVASLLLYSFPEDPLARLVTKNLWIKLIPAVEFRDRNNDFDVITAVKQAVGMVRASETYGSFVYDPKANPGQDLEISKYTPEEIQKISMRTGLREIDFRKLLVSASLNVSEPQVVRVIWYNPITEPIPENIEEFRYFLDVPYRRVTPVFLPAGTTSTLPFLVPGESVVFHSLVETQNVLMGKYNPALVNSSLSLILTDKFAEAMFWEKYAPGSMPKTKLLGHLISAENTPEEIKATLDKEFPKGWVLKGVNDHATDISFLITNESEFIEEIKKYRASDFLEKRKQIIDNKTWSNPDAYVEALKELVGYKGFRINRMFKEPEFAIVQEKLSIKSEYRVEVIAGRVLGDGSTVERYAYKDPNETVFVKNVEEAALVEKAIQAYVNKVPWELRGLPMGLDAAVLTDGTVRIIETNPQGNSGFLMDEPQSTKALNRFLKNYPDLVKKGEVPLGLTPPDQMKFIAKFLKEIGVTPAVHYPYYHFTSDGLVEKIDEVAPSPSVGGSCKDIFVKAAG